MHATLRLLLILLLAPFTAAAPRDVVFPGQRSFSHQLVIEHSEHFHDYVFVAAPVRGFHGMHVVVPGEPFSFSSKYGTRIYAVPAGEPLPDDLDQAWKAAHVALSIPVAQMATVSVASPLESLVTRLRIVELDGSGLLLAEASEQRAWSVPAIWLMGVAAATGILGVLWLLRRRRARAAASA